MKSSLVISSSPKYAAMCSAVIPDRGVTVGFVNSTVCTHVGISLFLGWLVMGFEKKDMGISPILELGCFRLTLALANVSKMSACPHWGKDVEIIKRQIASLILFEYKVSVYFQVKYLCCQVHWGKPINILIRWTHLDNWWVNFRNIN